MRFVSTVLIFFLSFQVFAEPILSVRSLAYAMSFESAAAEGRNFGFTMSDQYKLDNIDNTLRQKCMQYDSQGNCVKYMVDNTTGKGSLITDSDQLKNHYSYHSTRIQQGTTALQAQGAATGEYSYFLNTISRNRCIDYVPCRTSCRDFPNAFCNSPETYITGGPPAGATFVGYGYENFRHSPIDANNTFKCEYEVYEWYKTTFNNVDTFYKKFNRLEQEHKVCNETTLREDPIFSNKCFRYGTDGKCIEWSANRDILEGTYADCQKTIVPIYDTPGTEEKCTVPASSINPTVEKPPCDIRNTAEIDYRRSSIECDTTGTPETDQIYSVCKNKWIWYKVFDRVATVNVSCPMSCSAIGGYCSPPGSFSTGSPPIGSTFLGSQHFNFSQTQVFEGLRCSYSSYDWWFHTNTYYRQGPTNTTYIIPCPTTCQGVGGGGLCGTPPSNVIQGAPPSGATFIGESYEDFFGCTYKVYKWYRKLDYAEIERVKLRRTSNCSPNELDNMTQTCWTKEYEICQPNGTGCVLVVRDGQKVAENKVCKTENGTIHNYTICPNDGGHYVVDHNNYDIVGMTIDDQEGVKSVERNLVSEVQNEPFDNAVTEVKAWGGFTVKPLLNDWYARVIYSCDSYPTVPPECEGLVAQGCVYKDFTCIDPPQTNPGVVPICNTYEYTYQCGSPTAKIIGYEINYTCGSSFIPGLRCMGTDCADASYMSNQDFIAFATGIEILKQIQIDSNKVDPNNIRIFPGEKRECQSWPKNCCKSLSGAMGVAAYVQLGFILPKVYQLVTTGWTGMLATNVTLLGNYGGFLGFFSIEVAATADMSVALMLPEAGGLQFVGIGKDLGEVYTVVMADSTTLTVGTIMTAVSIALLVYSIVNIVYQLMFRCTRGDVETGIQVGQTRCVHTGTRCAKRILGICIKKKKVYCCFNSLLARIVHEQGRPQIGKGWGDCEGFTPEEMSQMDFSRMDFTEYMQHLEGQFKEKFTETELETIEDTTKGNVPNRQSEVTNRLNEYFTTGSGSGAAGGGSGSNCVFNIDPTQSTIGFYGGNGAISIISSHPTCNWSASSNTSWITITGSSSGSGNGNIGYSVLPNSGTTPRNGTITVAGRTFTVNQQGCEILLAPSSMHFGVSGGSGQITVSTTAPTCNWTVSSNSGWITITSGNSGTGNGVVSYNVANNSGANRSGNITISGLTFTISQSGQ